MQEEEGSDSAILAESYEQRLSKPLLSWWRDSVQEEEESDSATLAES